MLKTIGFGIIVVLLAFFPWQEVGLSAFETPKEICLVVIGLVAMAFLKFEKGTKDEICLWLWTASALVSSLSASSDPFGSAWSMFSWLAMVAIAVSTRSACEKQNACIQVFTFVAIGGLLVSLLTVIQSSYTLPLPTIYKRAPGASFGHRNRLAHALVLTLPSIVGLFMASSGRWRKALSAGALVVACWAIALTRCRAAWIAAFVIAICLACGPQRRTARVALLALATMGLIFAAIIPNQLKWSTSTPYTDTLQSLGTPATGSGSVRLSQHKDGLNALWKKPIFGFGLGGWANAVAGERYQTLPPVPRPVERFPNSDWLAFLVERGVLGTCFLVLALFFGWVRARTWAASNDLRGLSSRVGATTVGAGLLMGFMDAVILHPAPCFLVAVGWGLLPSANCSYLPRIGEQDHGALTPDRLRKTALRVLSVLVILLGVGLSCRRIMWLHHLRRNDLGSLRSAANMWPGDYGTLTLLAWKMRNAGDCGAATERAVQALRLLPHSRMASNIVNDCHH